MKLDGVVRSSNAAVRVNELNCGKMGTMSCQSFVIQGVGKGKDSNARRVGNQNRGRRERTLKSFYPRSRPGLRTDGGIKDHGLILAMRVNVGRNDWRSRRGAEPIGCGGDGVPGDRRERRRHRGRHACRHSRSWSPPSSFLAYLETNK